MLPMTPRRPSPPSNMEVESLCFGGVFLLRGYDDNCTASKGRWIGQCTVRARALKPTRALKMGHSVRVLSLRSSVIDGFVTEP